MKNRHQKIEQEINDTLQLFDEMEDIEVKPLFYSRLQSKIRGLPKETERGFRVIFGPSVL